MSVRLPVCLCPLITEGRRNDLTPQHKRLYLWPSRIIRWALWAPVWALATGTNTSFLDGLYKTKQQMETYIQWPAVRQAAWFVRSRRPSGHHGGSRFWLWLLAHSSIARGATSKLTTFWTFSHVLKQDAIKLMRMLNRMFQNGWRAIPLDFSLLQLQLT